MVGLALAAWVSAFAGEASLCTRLAEEVRRAPPATWAQADPLSNWVKPVPPSAPSPTVTELATDARWRELLAAVGSHPMGVQQLPGTAIYLVDDVAGTASCQSLVLVLARDGKPSRQFKPPFEASSAPLCAPQSAFFARVLGQPTFVIGGPNGMTSPDINYRFATWTGLDWSGRCAFSLSRQTAMTASRRFCAPGSKVCDAGQSVAQRLAQAYEAGTLSEGAFNEGRQPDAATAAALKQPLNKPNAIGDMNPPFPTFGADQRKLDPMLTLFSNDSPIRLAVWVDGRWWLAVVGRSGVGWRKGDAVLVALFAPPGRSIDGVASYQFVVRPAALRDVTATDQPP